MIITADLKMPVLSLMNDSVTRVSDHNLYEVTVFWTSDECSYHDVHYGLSVSKPVAPDPMHLHTNSTQLNIALSGGIEYVLTVTAHLCGRSLMSNALHLSFRGMYNIQFKKHLDLNKT